MVRRSVLFSPGDSASKLRKAPTSGADVVVFDFEDGVAPERKPEARETVSELLADPAFDPDCEVWIRVNPDPETAGADLDALDSLDAVDARAPDAVALPKVEATSDVDTIVELLAGRGLDCPLIAIVETATGVLSARDIGGADPVDALCFGAEDYAADVGAGRTEEGTEVLYAREHVVAAAAAAGVDAIDTIFSDFEDEAGLRADARFARQLGFDGKFAIHPVQVAPINAAVAPDPEEVAWARRVLAARDEHPGEGVFRVEGEMIDAPLLARAERIVSLTEEIDDD